MLEQNNQEYVSVVKSATATFPMLSKLIIGLVRIVQLKFANEYTILFLNGDQVIEVSISYRTEGG